MKTIDELEYYCKEEIPSGALLLTGDWGCGKTYLIDHQLSEKVKEEALIMRVSLFGTKEMSEIDSLVKNEYRQLYFSDNNMDMVKKAGRFLKNISEKLKDLSTPASYINATFDVLDLFPIVPKINGKKVIIVFDDLERFQGNTTDALGLINKYCENKGFHVIIVMNPEVLEEEEDNNLSFSKIKEKVIKRTIHHKTHYYSVLQNIIQTIKPQTNEYKDFLIDNLISLLHILEINDINTEDVTSQYNLRSIKTAMIDFERIYNQVKQKQIPVGTLSLIYQNFVCAVLLIKSGEECNVEKMSKKFPASQIKYLPQAAIEWVDTGEYKENLVTKQIEDILEWEKERDPHSIIRLNDLWDIDDDILKSGFEKYLNMFYTGQYCLEDYIDIVNKSYQSRISEINLPLVIDWNLIRRGLTDCKIKDFSKLVEIIGSLPNPNSDFNKDERNIIELIKKKYHDHQYANAKNEYLKTMQADNEILLQTLPSLRIDMANFDDKMANATISAYVRCDNRNKKLFVNRFFDFVGSNKGSDVRLSLRKLITRIDAMIVYENENKNEVTKYHLKEFRNQIIEKARY